ncbi:MAG: type II toxin-antitoxin system RelE/ParE family toxin [Alphaproteobacteria bacterium]|nr:type II toxin-antitoxin system RelE/ParE family toxin [Alphaproteobacteria bacterium]MBP7728992.1 type II toxin-antitoxin system RelE/ParE family toxin [Alphaproteobacteria bacterium]
MGWTIKFKESALKELEKISKPEQLQIRTYIRQRILTAKNPNDFGKPLGNTKAGLWRYRVEKFRIICHIKDHELCILIVKIGKRDKVYDA